MEGTPYKFLTDSMSKLREVYRRWRAGHGASMSAGLPTSNTKNDVKRHKWSRFTVIISHKM